ncbi:hypothetical protein HS088_TW03G00575 [Tripterygium wilfordii]|uniref:Uncharacterized protein n=1 Tax=Tripterygium wilfordii TaxID=458696 RepID=A0A7J7DV42_TRIWF|nr:hypothetical protein HS088_TW03G00575 [Tripterygium wilfordii]
MTVNYVSNGTPGALAVDVQNEMLEIFHAVKFKLGHEITGTMPKSEALVVAIGEAENREAWRGNETKRMCGCSLILRAYKDEEEESCAPPQDVFHISPSYAIKLWSSAPQR